MSVKLLKVIKAFNKHFKYTSGNFMHFHGVCAWGALWTAVGRSKEEIQKETVYARCLHLWWIKALWRAVLFQLLNCVDIAGNL